MNDFIKYAYQSPYYSLLALISLTITITSICLAYKPVQIAYFTATGASLLFALTFSISSVVAEIYGYRASRMLANQLVICGLMFSVLITLFIQLPSPNYWQHQADFYYVFGNSLRFTVFGSLGSWLGYQTNIYVISTWRKIFFTDSLPLRIICANTSGELVLVVITTVGSFYQFYATSTVLNMLLFAYVSKIIYTLILAWPTALSAAWILQQENRAQLASQYTSQI